MFYQDKNQPLPTYNHPDSEGSGNEVYHKSIRPVLSNKYKYYLDV